MVTAILDPMGVIAALNLGLPATVIVTGLSATIPRLITSPTLRACNSRKRILIAKTPTAVPFEDMRVMLQNLIVQRFKFTFHKEDQPMPVFALTVGKRTPKLKDADPANRSEERR